MVDINTGVDDIGASTLAGAVVVGVSAATRALGGDASNTPRGIALLGSSRDANISILLNVLDLNLVSRDLLWLYPYESEVTDIGVVLQLVQLIILEAGRETAETLGVGVIGISLDGRDHLVNPALDGRSLEALLHLDDVLAIDKLDTAWAKNGSGLGPAGGSRGSGQRKGEKSEKSSRSHFEERLL